MNPGFKVAMYAAMGSFACGVLAVLETMTGVVGWLAPNEVWLFVWLAMLIVMPAARTPEQIASARGEALSAREVMDMAKRKSADLGKAAASGLHDAQRNLRETFGSRG